MPFVVSCRTALPNVPVTCRRGRRGAGHPVRSLVAWVKVGAFLTLTALALGACEEQGSDDFFQKALEHRKNGEIAASIIELKNALQADPDNAEARLLLGTVDLEVGDLAGAEKELGRARDLGIAGDRLVGPLVELWLAQGAYGRILEELPALRQPGGAADAGLLLAEGKAHQGLGRLAEAQRAYRATLALEPESLPALYGLAWTARQLGDVETARSAIAEALRLQPRNVDAIALKADLEAAAGNLGAAAAGYRDLLEVRPDHLEARVNLAGILFAEGDYRAAIAALDPVLAAVPSHGNANYLRAAIAVEQEDYETAKRHSERVTLTKPDHVPSLLIAASSNYALGLLEQAERYAVRVLDLSPGHAFAGTLRAAIRARKDEAFSRRASLLIDDLARPADVAAFADPGQERAALRRIGADCLAEGSAGEASAPAQPGDPLAAVRAAIAAGDPSLALARAQELEAAPPADAGFKAELARLYLEIGAFARLRDLIEDLLAGGPTDARVLCLAGPAYLASGAFDKARLAARSLTELRSDSAPAHLLLAKAYRGLGAKDRFAEVLGAAEAIDPAYPPLLVEGARGALAAGDAARASDLAARIAQEPDLQVALLDLRGGTELLGERFDAAAETYREALDADPATTRVLKRAFALHKAGAERDSRDALVTWLASAPDDETVLLALANKDLLAERYLEAAEGYARVLRLGPDNVQALNNLAWASLQLGQPEVAAQHAEAALQLGPDDPRVLDTLGVALLRGGEAARALPILRKAQALAPANLATRLHLAEALIALGEDDEAEKLLQAVLARDASRDERAQAAELLERLAP